MPCSLLQTGAFQPDIASQVLTCSGILIPARGKAVHEPGTAQAPLGPLAWKVPTQSCCGRGAALQYFLASPLITLILSKAVRQQPAGAAGSEAFACSTSAWQQPVRRAPPCRVAACALPAEPWVEALAASRLLAQALQSQPGCCWPGASALLFQALLSPLPPVSCLQPTLPAGRALCHCLPTPLPQVPLEALLL